MELISASNFPDKIKRKAIEIFKKSKKRPRDDKRRKCVAYCTYVAFLENGEHINIKVIATEYGISDSDLRQMITKGGRMVASYAPPNVFADANDILQTFLITLGLPEELIPLLKPWIDYVNSATKNNNICPWDICYALMSKYIHMTGTQFDMDKYGYMVRDRSQVIYVKSILDSAMRAPYMTS